MDKRNNDQVPLRMWIFLHVHMDVYVWNRMSTFPFLRVNEQSRMILREYFNFRVRTVHMEIFL